MYRKYLVITFSFLVFSCGEKADNPDPAIQVIAPGSLEETQDILTAMNNKTWKTKNFTLAGVSLDCRLDDTFAFNDDGTFVFNGGDKLCGLEDILRERTGTWEVLKSKNQIEFKLSTGEIYEANYQKISEAELILAGSWGGMGIKGVFIPSEN
jgi:Lipocalin-like domain